VSAGDPGDPGDAAAAQRRAGVVYLDSSAFIARHVEGRARQHARAVLDRAGDWCTSALSLTEALVAIDRLSDEAIVRQDLEDLVRGDIERCHLVPVDQACLDLAAGLARAHPIRLSDAIHLAAAARLPRPVTLLTFDAAQIPVALALGFDVEST
jgi:uncharacterized protein